MSIDCNMVSVVFRLMIIRINIGRKGPDNYISRYNVPYYAAWEVYSGKSGRWPPVVYRQMFNDSVNSRKILDNGFMHYGLCFGRRR